MSPPRRPVRLEDLPTPPAGRRGWPWTEAPPPVAARGPHVGVVTPSLNQGRYLEETLRSVLLQGYASFSYVVMDGGSTDGSRALLERYAPWLDHWQSQPDGGQAAAVRSGFERAGGELLTWINADDRLEPAALVRAAAAWRPGLLVAGTVLHLDPDGRPIEAVTPRGLDVEALVRYWAGASTFQQPGLFLPRGLYEQVPSWGDGLDLAFDLDLALCLLERGAEARVLDAPLAAFRRHPAAKSAVRRAAHALETARVARRHWPAASAAERAAHLRFVRKALLGAAREAVRHGRSGAAIRALRDALRPGLERQLSRPASSPSSSQASSSERAANSGASSTPSANRP